MIKSVSVLFYYLLFIVTFCNNYVLAQNEPIRIGSYILSSDDPQYTLYNNYQQMLDLGLNSVFQRAVVEQPGQQKNFSSLSLFPYVFAANDTAPQYAHSTGNIDWISYFTHAKYYRWEAEGRSKFSSKWCCWHKACVRSSCGFRMVK